MKKAIIFDLDGTLIESVHAHYLKHKRIGKVLGFDLDEKYFHESANGMDAKDFYPKLLKHYGLDVEKNLSKALKLHHKFTDEEFFKHIKIYPHVKNTLKKLKREGMKIALATSSPQDMALTALKKFEIEKYFDVITDGDEVKHTKPNPAIFLLARKELGVKKSECLIVEDAPKGVMAAKRAGIDCICLLTSNPKKDIPKYATIVENHKKLYETIKKF
jgi:HAD superfamily hydrolase (TIGR01509 family)